MEWALDYLNKPWTKGGRGPDTFDCWGLVYHIYKTHLGIMLPSYPNINASNLRQVRDTITNGALEETWNELDAPVNCCVVAMSKNTKSLHHVGIYLETDGGLILHSTPNACVIAQSERDLKKWGFQRIEYYQFKETLCKR